MPQNSKLYAAIFPRPSRKTEGALESFRLLHRQGKASALRGGVPFGRIQGEESRRQDQRAHCHGPITEEENPNHKL